MSAPELHMTRAGRFTRVQLSSAIQEMLGQPIGSLNDVTLFKLLRSIMRLREAVSTLTIEPRDFQMPTGAGRFW